MNLIITGLDHSSAEVAEFQKRGCALDLVPTERLLDLLKQDPYPGLVADAIVCFIDTGALIMSLSPITVGTDAAETLVRKVRRLPDSCAMLDGRKWRALPIIMVLFGPEVALSWERMSILASAESIDFVEALQDFGETFRVIDGAIRDYRKRLLAEFSNLGLVVSYRHGRYMVGPAINPIGNIEGFLYRGNRDQRGAGAFTFDRDPNGIEYEVTQFEALINRNGADEAELQRFFEEHPHFLEDTRISSPLPHVRLETPTGELLIPDFVIKPIVAYQRDSNWRVLDLKRPGAQLLAGRKHVRLSYEVTQAITQLRNYGDYFRDPRNTARVSVALGHGLRHPNLAVLIGRLRIDQVEELEKAQSREPDVRIVTYDEVLQRQQILIR